MKSNVKTSEPAIEKDKAFFAGAPEISIFVACCVLVNELRGLERGLREGDLTQPAFDEKSKGVLARLCEAVASTQRFDIVMPLIEPGHFSPFFWSWFNWWDDYLKALTPSEVAEAERRARERGSLIDDLRPKNHWVSYRKTPAICLEPCLHPGS